MQWFGGIDTNRDGLISAPELQRSLSLGGLHYSLQQVSNMVRCSPSRMHAHAAASCALPLLHWSSRMVLHMRHCMYTCVTAPLSAQHRHQSSGAARRRARCTCADACRTFDRQGKGALDCDEFSELHSFIAHTQRSFQSYADAHDTAYLTQNAVHRALEQAGAPHAPCGRAGRVSAHAASELTVLLACGDASGMRKI